MTSSPLFQPFDLRGLTLPNRIVMAPLTRSRAGAERLPNAVMAEYYAQRAAAGRRAVTIVRAEEDAARVMVVLRRTVFVVVGIVEHALIAVAMPPCVTDVVGGRDPEVAGRTEVCEVVQRRRWVRGAAQPMVVLTVAGGAAGGCDRPGTRGRIAPLLK